VAFLLLGIDEIGVQIEEVGDSSVEKYGIEEVGGDV
jgi:hypothetical protein